MQDCALIYTLINLINLQNPQFTSTVEHQLPSDVSSSFLVQRLHMSHFFPLSYSVCFPANGCGHACICQSFALDIK